MFALLQLFSENVGLENTLKRSTDRAYLEELLLTADLWWCYLAPNTSIAPLGNDFPRKETDFPRKISKWKIFTKTATAFRMLHEMFKAVNWMIDDKRLGSTRVHLYILIYRQRLFFACSVDLFTANGAVQWKYLQCLVPNASATITTHIQLSSLFINTSASTSVRAT